MRHGLIRNRSRTRSRSLLNQLFGKGKEPFWQQAYTNLVRWIIELHRVLPGGWVTLQDVYHCAIDKELFAKKIQQAQTYVANMSDEWISVSADAIAGDHLAVHMLHGMEHSRGRKWGSAGAGRLWSPAASGAWSPPRSPRPASTPDASHLLYESRVPDRSGRVKAAVVEWASASGHRVLRGRTHRLRRWIQRVLGLRLPSGDLGAGG